MPITTVTMYRCDDGSTYTREEDARQHQTRLDWFSEIKDLRNQGRQCEAADLLYAGVREGTILVNMAHPSRVPLGARGVAKAKAGGRWISVAWDGYDQSWEDPKTLAPCAKGVA